MQKFLSRLLTRLMKSWSWVLLIVLTILIKWVSLYPDWVERHYTYGFYPLVSRIQRLLFGWLPFSIGDLFYAFLVLLILSRIFRFFKVLFRKQLNRRYLILALQQGIFIFLLIYVSFNLFWGLNYNRQGIAPQLGLQVKAYQENELDTLCRALQVKLNFYAAEVDTFKREALKKKELLFNEGTASYLVVRETYPFLDYEVQSLKPSLLGFLGRWMY